MARHAPHLSASIAALTVAAGLVVAAPQAGAAGETCNGQAATIVGAGTINGTAGRDIIVGSPGDDEILAGGGNDLVCAGDGDDSVADGAGKDVVHLGAGDDVLVAAITKDSGDTVHGDAGADTASYELRQATVKVNLASTTTADDGGLGELDRLVDIENTVGGHGDDTLIGTVGGNVLEGRGGNDTITDLAGADVVRGGDGDDEVAQPKAVDPGDDLGAAPGPTRSATPPGSPTAARSSSTWPAPLPTTARPCPAASTTSSAGSRTPAADRASTPSSARTAPTSSSWAPRAAT